MMVGKIDMWNASRGFGFVKGDDGESYFLHISNISHTGADGPDIGTMIRFELSEDPKTNRTRAVNAEPLR
jgi:cold shock CspA family protein